MNFLTITGSPQEIGTQLGRAGQQAWHQVLVHTPLWQRVMEQQNSPELEELARCVELTFPDIWQELQGLAVGLNAPFKQVFAWNCRGDLFSSTSDGCTSLAGWTETGELILAHNEDGLPELYDSSFLVNVIPTHGVEFVSFAYPGSLCGHTFSVNRFGIVNIVNNIRAHERPRGLPRQILARAALNAVSLDNAIAVLRESPRSGAFHHTLAQAGDPRIISLEATGTDCSVEEVERVLGHANHLIHPALSKIAQKITDSSAARQSRIDQQLSEQDFLSKKLMLTFLSDQYDKTLPIYRQSPQDPDQENTLATAIFILSAVQVHCEVYRKDRINTENRYTINTDIHCENVARDQAS